MGLLKTSEFCSIVFLRKNIENNFRDVMLSVMHDVDNLRLGDQLT